MININIEVETAKLFDPQYKVKLGRLQRYVKSLGKKLMTKINNHGLYENAGQEEIHLAFDRMAAYKLDSSKYNYQFICYLRQAIRDYFQLISEDRILDEDWTITD